MRLANETAIDYQDMWQLHVIPFDIGDRIWHDPIANVNWQYVKLPHILQDGLQIL
jgi:hypothetical protein